MSSNEPAVVYKELLIADVWRSAGDFFKYLLRKWYVLLLAGILGGIIGIAYAWLTKPRYQAKMTFALEDNGGGLGSALSLASELGFSFGSGGSCGAST